MTAPNVTFLRITTICPGLLRRPTEVMHFNPDYNIVVRAEMGYVGALLVFPRSAVPRRRRHSLSFYVRCRLKAEQLAEAAQFLPYHSEH